MEDVLQAIAIRNRIIGALAKRARLRAGKTQRACAAYLGCTVFAYAQYEAGHWGLSLAQLEALARLFRVAPAALWDDQAVLPDDAEDDAEIVHQSIALRRKMVAIQFRQSRRAAGLTQQQVADLLGHSAAMVAHYERGERDVPLAELEAVAERAGETIADFLEEPPPSPAPARLETIAELVEEPAIDAPVEQRTEPALSDWEQQALAALNEYSPEVRDFVLKPTNALYFRIALLLSSMKADSLRQIAETLLDITY